MKKKILVCVMSIAAIICCAVGGTFAWLSTKTEAIVNTFTIGDINITLAETTTNYKMVPGNEISKDPTITVKANSEASWLFVKVDESTVLSDYITYAIADGWTQLTNASGEAVTGVYYREVAAVTADTAYAVIKDNKVTVKTSVTKQMMNNLEIANAVQPTLTFTAYAVQKDNIATALEAWALVTA